VLFLFPILEKHSNIKTAGYQALAHYVGYQCIYYWHGMSILCTTTGNDDGKIIRQ